MSCCLATLAALLLTSPALAGDAVNDVTMGQSLSGDRVKIAVWTTSGPASPEGVRLEITAFPGSPELAGGTAELAASAATEQLWTVSELESGAVEIGNLYTAAVTMMDDQAGVIDTVELPVSAGSLTCGQAWTWGGFGSAHAHLDVDEDGSNERLGIHLAGPSTPRIAAVSVELAPASDTATSPVARQAARLSTVQQLWTLGVETSARPGHRYQVDAIILDGHNAPYGSAYVAQLPVDRRAPDLRAPCPWAAHEDEQLAAR